MMQRQIISLVLQLWTICFLLICSGAAQPTGPADLQAIGALREHCMSTIDKRWIPYCDHLAVVAYFNTHGRPLPPQKPDPGALAGAVAPGVQIRNVVTNVVQYEASRLEKQQGSNTASTGSTSLVAKPGIATVLNYAVESGALAQSTNGTATTLQGNAGGLYRLLLRQSTLCIDLVSCDTVPVLDHLALTASLAISQNGISSAPIAGSGNTSLPVNSPVNIPAGHTKLQSLSVRYQISNKFDSRSDSFNRAFLKSVADSNQLSDVQKRVEDAGKEIAGVETKMAQESLDTLSKNRNDALAACVAAGGTDQTVLDCLIPKAVASADEYVKALRSVDPATVDTAIVHYYEALGQLQTLRSRAFEEAKGSSQFTIDYIFNHPENQPESHDVRLVIGKNAGFAQFNANLGMSVYGGTIPQNAGYGRLHYGQISLQIDSPLTTPSETSSYSSSWSLAGYWQYQPDPSVLKITAGNLVPGTNIPLPQDAQVLLGTAGSVWVTQAKITIKFKNGAQIPLAGKWSNKPDLLTGKRLGAQFGLTYDLSALQQLLGK